MTVNQAWQGRRFKTEKYRKWQKDFCLLLPKVEPLEGQIGVRLYFYLHHPLKWDVDNFIKPVLDCLQKKGLIVNDNRIFFLEAQKFESQEEKVKIEIFKL